MSEIICDRSIAAREKRNVYKTVVRPAVIYSVVWSRQKDKSLS